MTTCLDDSLETPALSRDPDDDKIIDCAFRAGADFIVSGDNDLLVLQKYKGVYIVTPAEYLNLV
jgi:predicted nucleic acid-binding protein